MWLLVVGIAPVLSAQTPTKKPVWEQAALREGRVQGLVRDGLGRAISGAMVSAVGNAASARAAVSDGAGKFSLPLPAGEYVLRTRRDGYESARDLVFVAASNATQRNITLSKQLPDHPVIVASAGVAAQPLRPSSSADADDDHPHDETAWRLRHLTRSVLHDDAATVMPGQAAPPPSSFFDKTFGSSARLATTFFSQTDFTGHVDLLTTSVFDASPDVSPGIASFALSAPVGDRGDWTIRGAVSARQSSSWVGLAEYRAKQDRTHALVFGFAYSTHTYVSGGAAADLPAVTSDQRSAGAVYGSDRWRVVPRLVVDYGVRLDRYGYVGPAPAVSPRAQARLLVLPHTFVTMSASEQGTAPGAEQFLAVSTGPSLPAERAFAPLGTSEFQIERVGDTAFGVEHQFGDRLIGIRAFRETSAQQLVTLFGVDPAGEVAVRPGVYLSDAAGDVDVHGWAVNVSGSLAPRVTGAIDYAMADARWRPGADAEQLSAIAPSLVRHTGDRVHDLTATLEASLPETATRLNVVYRVSNGFCHAAGPGFGSRFDIQLSQTLPFTAFGLNKWEALVDVRNLFHGAREMGALYDELLTISPPMRVLGGVRVRF
jgi:hypothetical protein